jgi:hypothetical protein
MSGVSSSVQFRGKEQVITAFENKRVDAWSIWQGKQFMHKGMGQNELEDFINLLDRSNTTAIYTLKVFEDIDDVKKIKANTDHDGSFNFRLYERDADGYMPFQSRQNVELEKKIDLLEERIEQLLEEKETEEENPKDILGTITGLLSDPDKLGKLIDLGKSLLGQPVQPAYVGNVSRAHEMTSLSPSSNAGPVNVTNVNVSEEQRIHRLGIAIDTLEKNDPLILEHLEKLASMASNKPDQFKMLVGMLDMY